MLKHIICFKAIITEYFAISRPWNVAKVVSRELEDAEALWGGSPCLVGMNPISYHFNQLHLTNGWIGSDLDLERLNEDSRPDGCRRDGGSQQVEAPPAANRQM